MFTQASNSSVGREVLGGVLRCNGSGQIIPILAPSDAAGGFFEVIITNATTLTVSSGTFARDVGEWHKHGRTSDDSIAPLSFLIRREQLARLQCA